MENIVDRIKRLRKKLPSEHSKHCMTLRIVEKKGVSIACDGNHIFVDDDTLLHFTDDELIFELARADYYCEHSCFVIPTKYQMNVFIPAVKFLSARVVSRVCRGMPCHVARENFKNEYDLLTAKIDPDKIKDTKEAMYDAFLRARIGLN